MRGLLLSLMLMACATGATPAEERAPAAPAYIGRARMLDDGSIEMFLIAHGPGGLIGHGLLTYRPGDPQYNDILAHLGPIKPGEEKPVRRWPDEK